MYLVAVLRLLFNILKKLNLLKFQSNILLLKKLVIYTRKLWKNVASIIFMLNMLHQLSIINQTAHFSEFPLNKSWVLRYVVVMVTPYTLDLDHQLSTNPDPHDTSRGV